jgi:hypothetical protein
VYTLASAEKLGELPDITPDVWSTKRPKKGDKSVANDDANQGVVSVTEGCGVRHPKGVASVTPTVIEPSLNHQYCGDAAIAPTAELLPFGEEPMPEPLPAPKKTRKGKPPPIPADPRKQTPAIRCLWAMNDGRYPPKVLWDDLICILGDAPDTLRLAEMKKEWVSRGYNPNSWKWVTSWYVDGITTNGRPCIEPAPSSTPRPTKKVRIVNGLGLQNLDEWVDASVGSDG